jgi:hypothetical protein
MIEVYALAAVAMAAAGGVVGFLAVVSLGIRREEAAYTMTEPTSDRLARCARAANGVYARAPGVASQVRHGRRLIGEDVVHQ